MGGFGSVLGAVAPLLGMAGIPGALIGGAQQMMSEQQSRDMLRQQQDLFMQQLIARQNSAFADAASKSALEAARIKEESELARTRRTNALRRAVARQKTLFSAQGLGSDSGSAEAVLLGLYDDARSEQGADDRLDQLRQAALAQSLDAMRGRNVLEATQLAQQQNLTRLLKGY